MKVRKRPGRVGGLQLVMLALFALCVLTLFKAAEKAGVSGMNAVAETLAKGALAATAAAVIARFVLLRVGLAFMAPWVAGAVAVAAFMKVGAWDLSASAFGLPAAPEGLSPGSGGSGDSDLQCADGLKVLGSDGVWRCRAAAA